MRIIRTLSGFGILLLLAVCTLALSFLVGTANKAADTHTLGFGVPSASADTPPPPPPPDPGCSSCGGD